MEIYKKLENLNNDVKKTLKNMIKDLIYWLIETRENSG